MSKKNSNVILKKIFEENKDISEVYFNFKKKIKKSKKKSFLVAVSGGPDSLALTALCKLLNSENKIKFNYVLINHNIRKNSKKEALKVKQLLKKYKINLQILNNKKKIDHNIQGFARNIRYEMLIKYCYRKNINLILTAHNLEDQVETFLIRLSRGSGLTGLSAMKPSTYLNKKVILLRPLLDTKKNLLIRISKKVFGKFFVDPSNKNTKYLRTKIRNLKKPLYESGIKYDQIIKSINNLASSRATLDEYFEKITQDMVIKRKNEIFLNFKKLMDFNNEIKIKIINTAIKRLKQNYYNKRSRKVENLIKNISSKNFKKATLGGCLFFRKKDDLCVKTEKYLKIQ